MNSEVTQSSLLARLRDPGENPAWHEFDRKYRELVRRYCLRRGLSAVDADDVHQVVMMKMVRALPGFMYDPARGRFRDYLYRAVHSALCEVVARPNAPSGAVGMDEAAVAARPGRGEGDDLWEQEWCDHHYRLALAGVRESFDVRSVEMFERLIAGVPTDQVAQEFATTPQAVHKVKQRIRDRLKELIEAQVRQEDAG